MSHKLSDMQCGLIINALNIYADNCAYSLKDDVEHLIELLDDEVHIDYHGIQFTTLNNPV